MIFVVAVVVVVVCLNWRRLNELVFLLQSSQNGCCRKIDPNFALYLDQFEGEKSWLNLIASGKISWKPFGQVNNGSLFVSPFRLWNHHYYYDHHYYYYYFASINKLINEKKGAQSKRFNCFVWDSRRRYAIVDNCKCVCVCERVSEWVSDYNSANQSNRCSFCSLKMSLQKEKWREKTS